MVQGSEEFKKCGFFSALKYGSNDPPQALVDPHDPEPLRETVKRYIM